MAKLGRTTARWSTIREGSFGSLRTEYALRRDGVLLRKNTFLNEDGSNDHSEGWKIASRSPSSIADLGNHLVKQGFKRVYKEDR